MTLQPAPSAPALRADDLPSASPTAAGNGETQPSPTVPSFSSRLPRPRHWSRRQRLLTAALLGLLVVGGVLGCLLWVTGGLFGREPFNGPTATVRREVLKVTIVERGSLEAAKNNDIYCRVRAGQRGGTNASSIKWIVDNGAEVKAGEKLIDLDESGFVEALKDQNIKVDNAKSDMIQADEKYGIDEIESQTNIQKAKNALELAKINLEKYTEGDYVQALKDINGRLEDTASNHEMWKDRAAWSKRMVLRGFVTKSQADADQSKLDAARFAWEKVIEEKRVLEKYTKRATVMDLESKVKEAKLNLDKTNIQAEAQRKQNDAARRSKRSVYDQEMARKKDIELDISRCHIVFEPPPGAPQTGLVVYYMPEQSRFGGGAQQSIIAQGEPVKESQKLIQIPDLSQMVVNVRVHEAMVSYLQHKDKGRSRHQAAEIRVEAFSTRVLHGKVEFVDTMASQLDFFAGDVKVYKTIVSIDKESMASLKPGSLKPGMSAEVTIEAAASPGPVLVIPVQAVVGSISMGAKRKCFVVTANGQTQLRDIVVGMSNDRMVEVQSGLAEGEKVVLNPRPLLPDDSELKPGKVRSKKDEAESESSGTGEKKSWKGPKGADSPGGGPGLPGAGKGQPGGAKGMPGAGKGGQGGGGAGGYDPEATKRKYEELKAALRAAPREQRRAMLNQRVPEQWREPTLQQLRKDGIDIPD
jgi:hypothetical protein